MDYKRDPVFRAELLDFWRSRTWISPLAVTLTLRDRTLVGGISQPLSRFAAQQNLRHMLNVLRKQLLKHGLPKRTGLQRAAILEGGDNGHRLHYHLILDNPTSIDLRVFRSIFEHTWPRTTWGHERVRLDACRDYGGWLAYILKTLTKENYADSIDWTNCE